MTRVEFFPIMAYLQAGCGMKDPPSVETVNVYFDLLGDLDAAVVLAAAKQCVLNHVYPSLPPAGVIRKAAMALTSPAIAPAEAWRLFLAAVRRHGSGRRRVMRAGKWQEFDAETIGLNSLPPAVAHAARCFGWQRLADTSPEHIGIAERDFIIAYTGLATNSEAKAIMPPSVRAIAESVFKDDPKQLPALPAVSP